MGLTKHKVVQKTPHAAVIVWNYKNRLGSELKNLKNSEINAVESLIISTVSLVSIQTIKTKSQPIGNFTITMAPTKNWNSTLTEGSWMAILMSQKKLERDDFFKVNSEKIKFFGRIESIRSNITVDGTGIRRTVFSITGTDWGSIFQNIMYIDPLAQTQGGLSNATALAFASIVVDRDNPNATFTSREMLKKLKGVWGDPKASIDFPLFEDKTNLIINPDSSFTLPRLVRQYFNFKDSNIVDNVLIKTGKLKRNNTFGQDTYIDVDESNGYLNIADLIGQHTVWQVLQGHSCPTLNEMFCDLRFERDRPILALYNRIKPFYIKKQGIGLSARGDVSRKGNPNRASPSLAEKLISRFDDVRKFEIPVEDILSFEAGTNWRDKFNFIEIRSGMNDNTLIKDASDHEIKQASQLADIPAFQREGFRPYIAMTKQIPLSNISKGDGTITSQTKGLKQLTSWKFLLKEWYFDTHRLLNGTINFMGQDCYVQVGDNILINADILSATDNYSSTHRKLKDDSHLLLHVESVAHSFSVSAEGARNWITTIKFVRGIMTNERGKVIGQMRTDDNARALGPSEDKNRTNVFTTSTETDPDTKVKGK